MWLLAAMTQMSSVGVPAGAVLDTNDLVSEPSFYERGILQTMTHGERKMQMPTWPVRFDGVPAEVKSAPLLGEHTAEVRFGFEFQLHVFDSEHSLFRYAACVLENTSKGCNGCNGVLERCWDAEAIGVESCLRRR